jgi:deaminated glutathione amidase
MSVMRSLRVAAIQLTSGADRDANLRRIDRLLERAAAQGCQLAALPEVANVRTEPVRHSDAEPVPGPTTNRLAESARRLGIWINGGSLLEQSAEAEPRAFNTSVLIDPHGRIVASYRKIHLFDVDLDDGSSHRESRSVAPGCDAVTTFVEDLQVGLSVCYDLRFPELYRLLATGGARVLFIPSAFTALTGKAHWEVLLRARAIENQAFVVAPAQLGAAEGASACYGHSLIVDPWGEVLAEADDEETVIVADLDVQRLERLRREFPSLANRRLPLLAPEEAALPRR